MKIESPVPTYIAYEVSYLNDSDLLDWALAYLPSSDYFSDDSDLIELLSLNKKNKRDVEKAGDFLASFIKRQWPEFSIKNNKSEFYAKKYFHRRLREYLDGSCRPYDVCKMINPIEQLFDFPSWLGDMYNACDWIEPETKPSECRHLEDAIVQTLKL